MRIRVGIFLSVFDVHVEQGMPTDGRGHLLGTAHPATFLDARHPECSTHLNAVLDVGVRR